MDKKMSKTKKAPMRKMSAEGKKVGTEGYRKMAVDRSTKMLAAGKKMKSK